MPPQLITLEPDGNGYVEGYEWYVRSSVVNALWGEVMGRLAAKVWLSELGFSGEPILKFPPDTPDPELIYRPPGAPDDKCLWAHKIEGAALREFWTALAEIAFPKGEYPDLWNGDEFLMPGEDIECLDADQRQILLVLQYFEPEKYENNKKRMKLRVIRAEAYDFILFDGGLDLFVPPKPYGTAEGQPAPALGLDPSPEDLKAEWTRQEIMRMYKFRETGPPPIGLSGVPATSSEEGQSYLVPITAAPTGPTDVPHDWMRGMAGNTKWWFTGSLYASMNQAIPRLVASLWFEELTRPLDWDHPNFPLTYKCRWQTGAGLRELIQHRLETKLNCEIELGDPDDWNRTPDAQWNPRDLMITNKGLVVPYPGKCPEVDDLLEDIVAGAAGNPVFTNTIPTHGE